MARFYSNKKLDLSDTTKLLAHFWSKVLRCDHSPSCDRCCWLWQAGAGDGYGELAVDGKIVRAHRLIYRLTYGEILPCLYVCHRCDVRLCVNPQHLWLGTARDNMHDAIAKGRARPRTSEGQKKLYAEHPEYVPKGEQIGTAKLTESQVLAIRRAYRSNRSHKKLAAQFGVTDHTIYCIVSRRTWRHLPDEDAL